MVKEKFIVNIDGRSYVTYEGLLDLAHSIGLSSIDVEIIQVPSNENNMLAICKATAVTKDGDSFVDVGDASPLSVKSAFAPHIIRMASTRAKARALRDLTNVGITALEELSIEEHIVENQDTSSMEKPSQGQIETLKKLAKQNNQTIDFNSLTKYTAGELIKKLQV